MHCVIGIHEKKPTYQTNQPLTNRTKLGSVGENELFYVNVLPKKSVRLFESWSGSHVRGE